MKARPSKNRGDVVLEMSAKDEPLLIAAHPGAFRLRHLLVPVDFSDCSRKALRYAAALAQQHNATVQLLHVVSNNFAVGEYGGISYGPTEKEVRKSSGDQLDGWAADELDSALTVKRWVRIGSAAAEIVNVAQSIPADLIVVGTHGRTGLKHVLLGSVAEHVVRYAPCPVLVVREHEREFVRE